MLAPQPHVHWGNRNLAQGYGIISDLATVVLFAGFVSMALRVFTRASVPKEAPPLFGALTEIKMFAVDPALMVPPVHLTASTPSESGNF